MSEVPSMTVDEFFDVLERWNRLCDSGFIGHCSEGSIGPVMMTFPRDIIPLKKDDGGRKFKPLFCPINAMCLFEKGKQFRMHEWDQAALLLGLSQKDARDLVLAIDMHPGHNRQYRDRMLRALNLRTGDKDTRKSLKFYV